MATVVNAFPDNRYADLGEGLGTFAGYLQKRREQDEIDKAAIEAQRQIALAPDYDSATRVLNAQDPKVIAARGDQLRQTVQDKFPEFKTIQGYGKGGVPTTVIYKAHDDPRKALEEAGAGLTASAAWGVEIDGTFSTASDEMSADKQVQTAVNAGRKARKISPYELDPSIELEKLYEGEKTARMKAQADAANAGGKMQDWEATAQARFMSEAVGDPIVAKNGLSGIKTLVESDNLIDTNFKTIYGTTGAAGVSFESPGRDKQYQTGKRTASTIIGRGGGVAMALQLGKYSGDIEVLSSILDDDAANLDAKTQTMILTDKSKISEEFNKEFGLPLSDLYKTKIAVENYSPELKREYDPRDPTTIYAAPILKNGATTGTLRYIFVNGKFVPVQRLGK